MCLGTFVVLCTTDVSICIHLWNFSCFCTYVCAFVHKYIYMWTCTHMYTCTFSIGLCSNNCTQIMNYLVFLRKDLCETREKPHSMFKFSDNLSALSQMYPPGLGYWSGLTYGQTSGQPDLWSDDPSRLGFRSGWHLVRLWVRLTFGEMYPPGWGFGSGWHLVRLWVRLTIGQMYPPQMRLHVRLTFGKTFGQADLWSDVPSQDEALGQPDI